MTTIDQQAKEIIRLKRELEFRRAEVDAAVAGNARVIHALDCALQWGEALFAYLPEGMVLPEGVKTAKGALTEALKGIRR